MWFGGQKVADGSRAVVKSAAPQRRDPLTCDRALPRSRVASSQLVHPILRAPFALDSLPLPFTPLFSYRRRRVNVCGISVILVLFLRRVSLSFEVVDMIICCFSV